MDWKAYKVTLVIVSPLILCGILGIICLLLGVALVFGSVFAPHSSFCSGISTSTASRQPYTFILPDLRNLSLSDNMSLLAGSYELSNEYSLKMESDLGVIMLCVVERESKKVLVCLDIGGDVEQVVICGPDMRPDCLPSAITTLFTLGDYFGVSLWFQNDSTVIYTLVDISSSALFRKDLTNTTTTLSAVWFELLNCQFVLNLGEAGVWLAASIGIFIIPAWFVYPIVLACCWLQWYARYSWHQYNDKRKRAQRDHTPTVSYRQLMRREQDEELGVSHSGAVDVPPTTPDVAKIKAAPQRSTSRSLQTSSGYIYTLSRTPTSSATSSKPPQISSQVSKVSERLMLGSSTIQLDEATLKQLFWMPFGFNQLPIEAKGGIFYLEPPSAELRRKENFITVKVPREAVATATNVEMHYAIIADGPFALPEGYRLGSMVVYLYYNGSHVTQPVKLSLPHWYGGEDHVKDGLSFAMAPHSLKRGQRAYQFELIRGGTFLQHQRYGILSIDGHSSLFTVVFKEKATSVYLATQWDKRLASETRTKIVITYDTDLWLQIVAEYWKSWKMKEGTSAQFRSSEGSVCGELSERKGEGWTATLEGSNTVSRDDVVFHKRYTKVEMERKVNRQLYPPAIQYAVIYNLPPDFETISKVLDVKLTGTDKRQISFSIRVYQTNAPPPPPTLGPSQAEATPLANMSVWDAAELPPAPTSTTQSVPAGSTSAADQLKGSPHNTTTTSVPRPFTSLVQYAPTERANSLSVRSPPARSRVTSAPLDPLRQKPVLKDLNNKVAVRVAGKWETTGLELNIEDYVLQAIKTPNGTNAYHCREMFRCWLAREEGCGTLPRTWSTVLHVVENSCGSEVSREIKEIIYQIV